MNLLVITRPEMPHLLSVASSIVIGTQFWGRSLAMARLEIIDTSLKLRSGSPIAERAAH